MGFPKTHRTTSPGYREQGNPLGVPPRLFGDFLMRVSAPSPSFLRSFLAFLLVLIALPALSQSASVQAFHLVNGKSGWLLAGNRLFWTDTLGSQWAEITPTAASAPSISGTFFRPDGVGLALLTSADAATFTIARTPDHGAHWSYSPLPSPFIAGLSFGGKAIPYFADAQHGWLMLSVQSGSAFRMGILLRTSDGGLTWTQAPRPPVGGDLYFTDALHGWIGPGPQGDELYQTADGGQSWHTASLPPLSPDLTSIHSTITLPTFTGTQHGTLLRTYVGDQGTTIVRYETSDAGATWTPSATAVKSAANALLSIAADGTTPTPLSAASAHAAIAGLAPSITGTLMPTTASFSTQMQGWVLFTGGSCQAGTCTQTSSLMGTLDGGKTFFSLAQIPGIELESTHTADVPSATHSQPAIPYANPTPESSYPVTGVMGFDACSLPTVSQMQTWYTSSPYRVLGAYIGGVNFACSSGLSAFTPAYTASVLGQGWEIIPIWVGPQAPGSGCTSCSDFSTTPATATAQGVTEADSAVAAMQNLGMLQGSTIIYDMEAYSDTVTADVAATQAFIQGWDSELHAKGYLAAVYSGHGEFDSWTPNLVTPAIDIIWFTYFFSDGVACGTTCQTVYPTPTSTFDLSTTYWLNNHRARQTSSAFNSTYGSLTLNIDEDWVDAAFSVATPNTLTVTKTGTGSGTVASTNISNGTDTTIDTVISCGAACSSTFAPTDIVTLSATPASGSTFSAWTGCTTTSGSTCTINTTASSTVSAAFASNGPVTYPLTVTKSGAGSGTVTSSDNLISCGTTCSASYAAATPPTTVTLTATATTGNFTGFTGCATVSGNVCTVIMSAAQTVTATFAIPSYSSALSSSTLSIAVGQTGADNLNINPVSGYTGTFTSLSCSGLPATVTCAFNPTSLTATGNNAALTSAITITVPAAFTELHLTRSSIVWAGIFLPSLLLALARPRRLKGTRPNPLLLLLFALAAMGMTQVLTGCGSSSSANSGGGGSTSPYFSGTIEVNFTTSTGVQQLPIQLTITH